MINATTAVCLIAGWSAAIFTVIFAMADSKAGVAKYGDRGLMDSVETHLSERTDGARNIDAA